MKVKDLDTSLWLSCDERQAPVLFCLRYPSRHCAATVFDPCSLRILDRFYDVRVQFILPLTYASYLLCFFCPVQQREQRI